MLCQQATLDMHQHTEGPGGIARRPSMHGPLASDVPECCRRSIEPSSSTWWHNAAYMYTRRSVNNWTTRATDWV